MTPLTSLTAHTIRAAATLFALLALVVASIVGAGQALAGPPNDEATTGSPVLFIGVSGLSWSDVSAEATPALWEQAQEAVGSISVRSVRSVTCPLDGWLALNTSSRAAGPSSVCDILSDPVDSQVPHWRSISQAVEEQNYSAKLGTFAANLSAADISAIGIGPGAAIALADEHGATAPFERRRIPTGGLDAQVAQALAENDLVVIDAGVIRPTRARPSQVDLIERRMRAILEGAHNSGTRPTVILASLADDGSPAARTLMITGPAYERGVILSPSTRQEGYTLTTDLQATVLNVLGAGGEANGTAIRVRPSTQGTEHLVAAEQDRQLQSIVLQPPIIPTFFTIMVVLNVALYAAVAIGLKRGSMSRLNSWFQRRSGKVPPNTTGMWLPPRTNVLRALRVIALAIAALPVASYLANAVPWWRAGSPGLALTGAILVAIAALVALSLAGPWRRAPLGPPMVIAGVLAAVLGIDVALGSPLQLGSVMGNPPVVAGRWYGMNNTAFSQFSTAMILLSIAAATPLVRRSQRGMAALVITAFGILTAFVDGAPFLGADFGGPPAILPAFLILALITAGVRITAKRVGLVFIGTAAIVLLIAFLDWLRPPAARSHIGNFFQQVLDGELLVVIWRKLDANLRVLMGNRPLTILALSAVLLVVFVLARPIRSEITAPGGGRFSWLSGGTPISAVTKQAPLLPGALVAAAIVAGLGMAANDSGIAIPANVAAVLVPSLIAATATWMLGLDAAGEETTPS